MTIPDPTPSAAPLAATVPDALLEFRNIRIVYDNAIEAIRDGSISVTNQRRRICGLQGLRK